MALTGRRFWMALAGIAVAAVLAVTAISFWGVRDAGKHRSARPSVTPADSGLLYAVVPLQARDGTVLEGWWIRPRDGVRRPDLATIVLAHPADGERPGALTGKAGVLRQAAWLSRAGFIVLAFDFRSYGGSQGDWTSGGYLEQQDLEAAVRLARERSIGAPIAVLGEGAGASVALAVAAQDPSVKAVVADSPRPIQKAVLPDRRVIEQSPLVETIALASARPVQLIVGGEDHTIPKKDWDEIVKASGPGNATWSWMVPKASRLGGFDQAGLDYRTRIVEFLDSAVAKSVLGVATSRPDSSSSGR